MVSKAYTEDTLVQQTTAEYLTHNLAWDESIYAMDEKLGKEGTLGRESGHRGVPGRQGEKDVTSGWGD